MKKYIRSVANNIHSLDFLDISEAETNIVKLALIDLFGVAIAGTRERCAIQLQKSVFVNPGRFSMIGTTKKTDLFSASLYNGTVAHALDFDDAGAGTQGHPSSPVIPALLSLSEREDFNGKTFITSYIAGVEIFYRMSQLAPSLHLKGWHPTAVLGSVASAGACSKALGLHTPEIANALSIAASLSGGLVNNFGSMVKPLHVGNAVRNGVFATLLAADQYTSSNGIFDEQDGFLETITSDSIEDKKLFSKNWKSPFAVLEPGLRFKPYPSCAMSHRSIDNALRLRQKHNFNTEQIVKVVCRVTPRARRILFYDAPKNGLEAKFSAQFTVATALKYGEVTLNSFTEDQVVNSDLKKIMEKIDFGIHEDWVEGVNDWRPDVLIIELDDGSTLRAETVYPRGHPENTMSYEEINAKFKHCTSDIIENDKSRLLCEAIESLENEKSIQTIMQKAN